MSAAHGESTSPIRFTFTWLGIATVVLVVVGLLAGLVREDVPGTLGAVLGTGLLVAAAAIAGVLLVRGGSGSR